MFITGSQSMGQALSSEFVLSLADLRVLAAMPGCYCMFFCSIIACHVTVFTVLWCVGIHLPSGSGALQSTVWRCDFAAIFRISFQRKDVTVGKTQVSGEFVAIYLARTWLDPWHGSRQVACTKVPNVLNDKWSSIYACSYSMLEQSLVLWSRRHPHLISWQI